MQTHTILAWFKYDCGGYVTWGATLHISLVVKAVMEKTIHANLVSVRAPPTRWEFFIPTQWRPLLVATCRPPTAGGQTRVRGCVTDVFSIRVLAWRIHWTHLFLKCTCVWKHLRDNRHVGANFKVYSPEYRFPKQVNCELAWPEMSIKRNANVMFAVFGATKLTLQK